MQNENNQNAAESKFMTSSPEGFYRRPLPAGLVAFASAEGRILFREALAAGTMESFFALVEQFHTQAEPAFCGLGSLVVALNALEIDPGRLWKGSWRWYSEALLDCCLPLDVVGRNGVTMDELGCLARCNGAEVELHRADEVTLAAFRHALVIATTTSREPVLVVSYARQALGQTGDGHFSPIGGYHEGRDLALVLDVARFKYPPHWVPVEALYRAMFPVDVATGRSRGFVLLRRSATPGGLMFRVVCDRAAWQRLEHLLREELPKCYADLPPQSVDVILGDLAAGLFNDVGLALHAIVEELAQPKLAEYRVAVTALRQEIQTTTLFMALRQALLAQQQVGERTDSFAEIITLVILAIVPVISRMWPATAYKLLFELAEREPLPPLLHGEVARLHEQVMALGLLQLGT